MDQKSRKTWLYALLTVTLLVVVAAAGVMTLGHNTTNNAQIPGILPENISDSRDLFPEKAYPEYAQGYSVEYHGSYKVVQIHDPWGRGTENHTYLLVQRGEKVPDGYPYARVFFVPVESVITLTVLQVAHIGALNETPAIKGHNGINHILNEAFRERAVSGKITEIGSGTRSMNTLLKTETMIELDPDLVFCNANRNMKFDNQQKLVEAGLSPVITAEWMEDHPLGRAEWIKFYSLFFNREKEANEFFTQIDGNYTSIREKANNASRKPTIFSGMEYQGTWYAPAGGSYVAQLFRDAGGDYILANDTGSGNKPLDFERVYERAHNADFYINVGVVSGVEDLLAREPRYSKFDAVKKGTIYHFDARTNEYGSLDYWQSGVIHPDIILADLVKILHPDLIPDHELYYYRHVGAGRTGDSP